MSSLVADYGSSPSDSDSEEENERYKSPVMKRNFLASQDSSGSSDSDSADVDPILEKSKKDEDNNDTSSADPLPLPNVFAEPDPSGSGKNLLGLSVFANPFEQARQKQLNILEKHVKLKEQPKSIPKEKVCYKFQKGKCRFGDKCKFLHAADNKQELTGGNQEPLQVQGQGTSFQGSREHFNTRGNVLGGPMGFSHGFAQGYNSQDVQEEPDDEDTVQRKRKDKAGLSVGLVPSRKALKIYDRQRVNERPWTVKR